MENRKEHLQKLYSQWAKEIEDMVAKRQQFHALLEGLYGGSEPGESLLTTDDQEDFEAAVKICAEQFPPRLASKSRVIIAADSILAVTEEQFKDVLEVDYRQFTRLQKAALEAALSSILDDRLSL